MVSNTTILPTTISRISRLDPALLYIFLTNSRCRRLCSDQEGIPRSMDVEPLGPARL